MKEKEKLDKDKQIQEYVIKERKRVMGEIGTICSPSSCVLFTLVKALYLCNFWTIAFKEWLNKKRIQNRKEVKSKPKKKKDNDSKAKRPKTSHKEVFLAYSYMKKVQKPKGVKNSSVADIRANQSMFES